MMSRQPTADDLAGIEWWNAMTEAERAEALAASGWKSGGTWGFYVRWPRVTWGA